MEASMKKAVIYARYSSDKQDEASIEAQVRACREYAAGKGYAVLDVYADATVIIGLNQQSLGTQGVAPV